MSFKNLLLLMALVAVACVVKGQLVTEKVISVSGNLEYIENGNGMVTITYRKLGGGYMFDSCVVKDGKFQFEKQWAEPLVMVLSLKPPPGSGQGTMDYRSFLLVPGEVRIEAHKKLADAAVTGTGAIADADYQEFNRRSNLYIDTMNRIAREKIMPIKDPGEREKEGTRVMDSIGLRRAVQLYRATIKENPRSPVAIVALCLYANEPVWRPRKKMVPEEIESLLSGLPEAVGAYPTIVALKAELEVSKATEPGKPIVDFALKDTAGRLVHLSDYKGRYVFLDFWASWCAPCRKENPNVKRQFSRYKDKGFTVLSVSLDKPEARKAWIDAIHKDEIGLWTHVVDDGGFDGNVAKSYFVRSIPTNFLIGPDGRFINRNLYGEELNRQLAEIFAGK